MSFGKLLALVCGPILLVAAIAFAILDPVAVGLAERVRYEDPQCRHAEVRAYLDTVRPLFDTYVERARNRDSSQFEQLRVKIEECPRPPCADGLHQTIEFALLYWNEAVTYTDTYMLPNGYSETVVNEGTLERREEYRRSAQKQTSDVQLAVLALEQYLEER